MIYIVTAVHNRWDKTRQFLDSMKRQSVQDFEVIIVNDGSTDETKERLKADYPSVKVLDGDGSLWWTGATRMACDYVLKNYHDASYIIVANNDQVIAADAIERLVFFSEKYPDTIIGSVSRDYKDHDLVYDSASRIDWRRMSTHQVPVQEHGINIEGVDVTSGRFTIIPVQVFSTVSFDSTHFPHYLGDLDFFLQAKKNGYETALCYESVCYDIGGPSGYEAAPAKPGVAGYLRSQFALNSHDNLICRLHFIWRNCPSTGWKYQNIAKRLLRFAIGFIRSAVYSAKHRLLKKAVFRSIDLFVFRLKIAWKKLCWTIRQLLNWLFSSKETTNFTYDLESKNIRYLAAMIADVSGCKFTQIVGYIDEILNDERLQKHIGELSDANKEIINVDDEVRCGRRIGWYAFVRVMKPKVVVETGVDKGLGACILTSALMKNAEEGYRGYYYGTDINPKAGHLFSGAYRDFGEILYGDSIESLQALEGNIDIFINDSDHSDTYEEQEYQTIKGKLSSKAILLGDNSHVTDKLLNFALETDRQFLFFQEKPENHWYPGGGIGIAYSRQI